jgi:hypothetical protein
MVAVAQHIAGLPVEEVLLAAAAAMAPLIALIALVGWEISSRVKKIRSAVRRRSPDQLPDSTPEP